MRSKLGILCFSLFIILGACSDDDEESPQDENFYMEFVLDGSPYLVSTKEHQIEPGGGLKLCAEDGYIAGYQRFLLWDPTYENYIHSINFTLSRKVFKDELNLSDESSYMKQVLNAESYGFPTNQGGYFSVYDLEKEIFEVSREVGAEGYLSLVTNEEEVYHSTSVVPIERDKSTYLIIEKVIENPKNSNGTYDYIVEGRFKVDLVNRDSGTDTKIMEGKFRWPVKKIPNSDLLLLCK